MLDFAKLMIIIGVSITIIGVGLYVATRYFPWLGNLPGDLQIESENFKIYFPLATMVLISIIGTILLNIAFWIFRK